MKRFFILLLMFVGAVAGRATQVDDPADLLPESEAAQLDHQLEQLQKDTGIRVVMQFHQQEPPPEEDNAPGVYMRGLSTKLGLIEDGVLAVYFADVNEWRVWIGNNLASRFAGRAGTAEELTKSGAMHDAKEAWLKQVFDMAQKKWGHTNVVMDLPPKARELVRFQALELIVGLREKCTPQK